MSKAQVAVAYLLGEATRHLNTNQFAHLSFPNTCTLIIQVESPVREESFIIPDDISFTWHELPEHCSRQ